MSLPFNESRLIELESKFSHQDLAIEELQKVVFDQHATIERLEKNLKELRDRIESVFGVPEIGPGNEKPPHY